MKLGRLFGLLFGGGEPRGHMLSGFLDSLLQGFENCRPGLSDETARAGGAAVQAFFLELYEKQVAQLRDAIRLQEPNLGEDAREDFFRRTDELVRRIVIPAYARLASRQTLRERNDFYLAPDPFHGLERLGWGGVGVALGAFAVWAPFIPLWEKEWILPFAIGGLVFPNVRRFLALRRYQAELNRLVARADDEIWRMDLAYLTSGEGLVERPAAEAEPAPEAESPRGRADAATALENRVGAALENRVGAAHEAQDAGPAKPKLREGGR